MCRLTGLYPLVGWKIGSELVFVAEGFSSDTGQCVEWAKSIGNEQSYLPLSKCVLFQLINVNPLLLSNIM